MQKNSQTKPRIDFKKKITLFIFGLFLFLILLEVGLRLGGFILLSIQERRNSQSIRQKGSYRIMCLGESTTQGEWPPFLEEILNQRNIGVRFSVIDKGRIGVQIPAILSKVESYLTEYHPDMVIAMMGINDGGGEHIPYEPTTNSKTISFFKSFRIYKLTRLLWLNILTKANEVGFYKPKVNKHHPDKIQTHLPRIELKESPAESISTEDALKKAIELNLKNDNAYIELGLFYRAQGKISQAEDAFKKALEINPKNDDAYAGLGLLYRDQGKPPQAEDAFKKAVGLNPKNDGLYFQLGWTYKDQGKISQAEDAFKKALEINPKNDDAYAGLGWLYRDQGKFLQVEELLKKATELNSENDRAYGAILVLYEEIGKLELAKEYVEKVSRLRLGYYNPITVNSYRKLKEILDKQGIRLVCVQYPMRSIEPLKKIFEQDESIIFVDNENVFKEALKKASYKEYFRDMFAGDFGHCTKKGNGLLAENIADVILQEVFNK